MIRTSLLFAAVAAVLTGACADSQPGGSPSATRYDAAHSIALDGTIEAGTLISPTNDPAAVEKSIRQQLMYTIGQFNGYNGGAPDMRRTEVTVGTMTARDDGAFDVQYSAKMLFAWPREYQIPQSLGLILPARGDAEGLAQFFSFYGADEASSKLCLASEAHAVQQSLLWYYYRPLKASCPLLAATHDQVSRVARFPIKLAVSVENTSDKAPEYQKVWEDDRLVVTAIFAKNEAGATSVGDAGINAYRRMYNDLLTTYGQPTAFNLRPGQVPDAVNNDVRMTFRTVSGPLDVALLLVDGIQTVDAAFKSKYDERTQISDFVSYNGHSGLGANIRALANMGRFVQGQYQIYMVNGCDTFAYVDYALRDAHQAVNPTEGPNRFIDIITNAMPSYFHMNSWSNMTVIEGLVNQRKTYRQILASFDINQRAGVTGEDDNRWPEPF